MTNSQIDYGGLIVAFETRGKLDFFLDLETGDVPGYYPAGRPEDGQKVADCRANPARFLPVPAETPEMNLGDRRAFLRTVEKQPLREKLDATFAAGDDKLAFREVLRADGADEERRWFRFKEGRVRERVEKWLAKVGLPAFPKPPESK